MSFTLEQLKEEVKILRQGFNLLYGIVVEGKEPPTPTMDAAVDAIVTRKDWGPYNKLIALREREDHGRTSSEPKCGTTNGQRMVSGTTN